ncbi:Bug family tripartite tricarboxylate transporter substrate binding protein [Aquabacterium sp.]|uniref:Bug family tripartite tricarboxylate transporter substrate binding protein n=1 Tax=Aquabacterium sp. TaxID=1872578 RepID=UPI002CFAD04B|nr:Bug family tripartite tricarboxylate transporter substrate binding protein [Aquabacterium sp.]HSW06170.1 Bug family tripartite tricarboxylate transporter substrate binding protein [Aquabacterium sp.]
MFNRRQLLISTAAGTGLLGNAQAAEPLETLRILSGFPAGGTVDVVARRVADKVRGTLAKVALVENKPGAGGRLAVDELKRAKNDGSTLLLTPAAMITLYPHLYPKLPYGIEDVTPVCGATSVVFGLAVGPGVPPAVKTLKDFLAWAKTAAGQANYGSPGAGSPPHFVGALLEKESGVALSHVPYRGTVPGIQDLLGGQLTSFVGPIGDYLPHVKTGKLRVLATSGPKRSRFLPEVPSFTELGFKALEQVEWYGFFLPGKAAADVVQRHAAAIKAAMSTLEMSEALAAYGLEVAVTSPDELAKAVKDENLAWGPIVKRIGFTPES